MNNIIAIVKTGLISSFRGQAGTGKRKIKKPLLMLLLLIAFLPLMFSFVEITRVLYKAFEAFGQGDLVLTIALLLGSIMVFLFGVFFTIGSYYMSKDVSSYLAMPLKPWEITAARFIMVLVYEYLVMLFFLLPVLVGFGMAASKGVLFYLAGAAVFLILPVLPLSIASIIIISIMSFAKKAMNKDRFSMISGIIALAIGLAFNFGFQRLAQSTENSENIGDMISGGQLSLAETAAKYFPGVINATKALINQDVAQLLIFLAVAALAFAIFLFVAGKLYFKGVIGISQQVSRKDFDIHKESGFEARAPIGSYLAKELRLIFRTPIYFMNLVLIDILLPVMMVVPILFSVGSEEFAQMTGMVKQMAEGGVAVTGAFIIFTFISAMNGITATSISREGSQLYIMKHIPVPYKEQMDAKLLSGMAVSGVGMIALSILLAVFLEIGVTTTVLMVFAGLNGVALTRLTGLFIDAANPKLNWDDEQKAVKQNMNLVYNMLLGMAAGAIGVLFLLFVSTSMVVNLAVFVAGIAAVNYALYLVLVKRFPKMIERIE